MPDRPPTYTKSNLHSSAQLVAYHRSSHRLSYSRRRRSHGVVPERGASWGLSVAVCVRACVCMCVVDPRPILIKLGYREVQLLNRSTIHGRRFFRLIINLLAPRPPNPTGARPDGAGVVCGVRFRGGPARAGRDQGCRPRLPQRDRCAGNVWLIPRPAAARPALSLSLNPPF